MSASLKRRIDGTMSAPAAARMFYLTLGITTVIKFWLAAAIPLTGDEAYFWLWGQYPSWGGFYDHPPMVGWWLWALDKMFHAPWALRLPAILLWILIACGMMDLLRRLAPDDPAKPWCLGSLFLALPFTWAFNLIATDTPLILFVFFSGYAFIRGEHSGRLAWHALAGILLGLALLSKYFAGMLAIAFAVYLVTRGPSGWSRLILIAVCASPFMILNLVWNAYHCWDNFLFNLFNRNEDSQIGIKLLLLYVGMMLYLVTPWVAWRLARRGLWQQNGALLAIFAVPLGLFFAISLFKTVGLHWVMAFLPFLFIWASLTLDTRALLADRRLTLWFGVPHIILLGLLAHLPASFLPLGKFHTDITAHRDTRTLFEQFVADLPAGNALMSPSYSLASMLSYHGRTHVSVFGTGSYHGRFDDSLTDFSSYDGKSIRIVSTRRLDPSELEPFFSAVRVKQHILNDATFWIADGDGFRFARYRDERLRAVATTYYRMPDWLPLKSCRFLDRYGFAREPR